MTISDPKSKYGEKVFVLNYRYKPPRWVEGECRSVQYKCGFGKNFSWQYDVYVRIGKGYFVCVNDCGIKEI